MVSNAGGQRFEKTLIFAHRGASTVAMENTRAAFDAALRYAIDGIETDVQLSKDEITVLWHDEFLDRIGLASKHIDDFDYSQLKTFNFPQTSNEGLMTFKQFLDNYYRRCRLLVEIKNRGWEPVCRHQSKMQQVVSLINTAADSNTSDYIIVSSFDLPSLVYAYQRTPCIPYIYNIDNDQSAADIQQTLAECSFLYGLCLPIALLNQHIINLLRTYNKCIAVYTCNTDDEIDKALKLGVDILISDVPDKALNKRNIKHNL